MRIILGLALTSALACCAPLKTRPMSAIVGEECFIEGAAVSLRGKLETPGLLTPAIAFDHLRPTDVLVLDEAICFRGYRGQLVRTARLGLSPARNSNSVGLPLARGAPLVVTGSLSESVHAGGPPVAPLILVNANLPALQISPD